VNAGYVLIVFIAAAVAMTFAWFVQLRTRNAGIVDAVWTLGVGAGALFYAWVGSGHLVPRLAVAMLGGIWASRLSLHIFARVLSEPEDGRYQYLRAHWHDNQAKFFGLFIGQAILIALFSLPFYAVAQNTRDSLSVWCATGVAIWIVSIAGESIADAQLTAFRKDPRNRGKTCDVGLWRYSRHPNYFFEWLLWFTYVFLSVGTPWNVWLLSWIGPVLMFASLMWVSGVPFAEAQALRSRGDDYRAYQRRTSVFFPWFPKKGGA
jgi:steroid 5-alpha reductase family enzyme